MTPLDGRDSASTILAAAQADEVCRRGLVIVIPVYEDWESVRKLLVWLGEVAVRSGLEFSPLLVDDGSKETAPADLVAPDISGLGTVRVLRLLRNLGHQRAITIGLAWTARHLPGRAVVVMDADGEDKPDDVPALVAEAIRHGWRRSVFAERTKRSEGLVFRMGYACYRAVHLVLTSKGVRYGNFSVLPAEHVRRLSVTAEIWNHFAAAVMRSRVPFVTERTYRGTRLAGKSKMNLPALVTHGLSALSVHGEVVATRLLIFSFGVSAIALVIMSFVAAQRFFTNWPIPGWTSQLGTLSLVLLMQTLTMSVVVASVTLLGRSSSTFIPARDFQWFVDEVTILRQGPPDGEVPDASPLHERLSHNL